MLIVFHHAEYHRVSNFLFFCSILLLWLAAIIIFVRPCSCFDE